MTKNKRSNILYFIVVLCGLFGSGMAAAEGKVHVVSAQATKFAPLVIFIDPGDTVVWKNMIGHNAESIEGLIPEGAEPFHITLGTSGSASFTVEGTYIYKCAPHFALGMVGAIIVGDGSKNMDQVKINAKGMAKRAVIKAKKALEKKNGK